MKKKSGKGKMNIAGGSGKTLDPRRKCPAARPVGPYGVTMTGAGGSKNKKSNIGSSTNIV